MRERENYRELILENIEYDYLCRDDRLDRDMLNELVELMVDTVCALYNAPSTIDSYYASLVNHDLYGSRERR